MNKLIDWLNNKFLPWFIAFILVFIPLYPKLPIIGITHTWVYIRAEDFLILTAVSVWFLLLIKRKVKFPQSISLPIFLFWGVGLFSTVFAIIFLFPHLANVFPTVAFLHFFRRVEYLILLFVAFSTIKKPEDVNKYVVAVVIAALGVIGYGLGQKFMGFPAFLTMNEEFAKGIPLYLPQGARITSTFGGHYDLAAYLVITISLIFSLSLGVKRVIFKILLTAITVLAVIVLLLTASRVSFGVYLCSIIFMLILQKKKLLIIPVVIISLFLLMQVRGTAERFAKTIRIQPVVINSKTGQPIAVLEKLPPEISGLRPTPTPVQETLPLGTGFIGLPPVSEQPEATTVAVIRKSVPQSLRVATASSEISTISGSFLIQKAFVYDISFTTRLQGQWPRAWTAFKNNILFGTGYSSIDLATDGDYLRMLGETGVIGLLSFLFIFSTYSLLLVKNLKHVNSPTAKSFIIGVTAGVFGLFLNAVLIDVFEASKVAQVLWILMGISVGLLSLYIQKKLNLIEETKKIIFSNWAILLYLFLISIYTQNSILSNYFNGEAFVWLKMAADSKVSDLMSNFNNLSSVYSPISQFLYFAVYAVFWLKPMGYHFVSILLYLILSFEVYLLGMFFLKDKLKSFVAACMFVVIPVNHEILSAVSSYPLLLGAIFTIGSFYLYLIRNEGINFIKLTLSLIFFNLGIFSYPTSLLMAPLLFIQKFFTKTNEKNINFFEKLYLIIITTESLMFILWQIVGRKFNGLSNFSFLDFEYQTLYKIDQAILSTFIKNISIPEKVRFGSDYFPAPFMIVVLIFLGVISIALLLRRANFLKNKNYLILITSYLMALIPLVFYETFQEKHLLISVLFAVLIISGFTFELIAKVVKNKKIAIALYLSLSLLLFFIYKYENDKLLNDWKKSGEISKKIIYSIKDNYKNFPLKSTLNFVNVPATYKRTSVYSQGLYEALWFIYRDKTMKVKIIEKGEVSEKDVNETNYLFEYKNNELITIVQQ